MDYFIPSIQTRPSLTKVPTSGNNDRGSQVTNPITIGCVSDSAVGTFPTLALSYANSVTIAAANTYSYYVTTDTWYGSRIILVKIPYTESTSTITGIGHMLMHLHNVPQNATIFNVNDMSPSNQPYFSAQALILHFAHYPNIQPHVKNASAVFSSTYSSVALVNEAGLYDTSLISSKGSDKWITNYSSYNTIGVRIFGIMY